MDKLLSMMGIDLKDILIREALDNNKDTLVTCPNNCRCGKCGLYFIPTGNEGSDKCLLVLQTDGVYRHFPADREEMRKFLTDCLAALDAPAEKALPYKIKWVSDKGEFLRFTDEGVEYDVVQLKPVDGLGVRLILAHPTKLNDVGIDLLCLRASLYASDQLHRVRIGDAVLDKKAVQLYREHYPNSGKIGNE